MFTPGAVYCTNREAIIPNAIRIKYREFILQTCLQLFKTLKFYLNKQCLVGYYCLMVMVFNVTFNIFQLYCGGGAITKPFIEVLNCSYIKLLFLQ